MKTVTPLHDCYNYFSKTFTIICEPINKVFYRFSVFSKKGMLIEQVEGVTKSNLYATCDELKKKYILDHQTVLA